MSKSLDLIVHFTCGQWKWWLFFFPCSSSNAHSIFFEGFMSTRIVVLVRCVKRTCWMGGEMVLKANEDAQLQRASWVPDMMGRNSNRAQKELAGRVHAEKLLRRYREYMHCQVFRGDRQWFRGVCVKNWKSLGEQTMEKNPKLLVKKSISRETLVPVAVISRF